VGDAGRDSGKSGDSGPMQADPVKFAVPEKGGAVEVPSQSGAEPTKFEFPASSAGKMITLTPVAASEIGWPADQFAEVIRMEPDGATFAEPIVIRPASGDVIVLDFPSAGSKSKPEALPLNEAGDGFLLSHFSTLVVVPPANSCDGSSGWVVADAEASKAMCKDAAFPQYISFSCSAHVYCVAIEASCCASAGAKACTLDSRSLKASFTPAPYDERYPYCGGKPTQSEAGKGGTGGTAGHGGAGAGGSMAEAGKAAAGSGGESAAGSGGGGTGAAGTGGVGGTGAAGSGEGGVGGTGAAGSGQGGVGGTGAAGSEQGGVGGTGAAGSGQGGVGGTGAAGSEQGGVGGTGAAGSEQGGVGGTGAAGSGQGGVGGTGAAGSGQGGVGGTGAAGSEQGGVGGTGAAGSEQGGVGGTGAAGSGQGGVGGTGAAGSEQGGVGGTGAAGSGQGGVGGTGAAGGGGTGGSGGSSSPCDLAGTWQDVGPVANVEYFNAVWGNPTDDSDVWAVGKSTAEQSGIIAHWDGSDWSTVLAGVQGDELRGVWASTSGTVYAVGKGGAIHRYESGAWGMFNSPTSNDLYGIWGTDASHFWVVGASGAAFYFNGADWVDHSIVGSVDNHITTLRSVWSYDGETIWVTNNGSAASASDYVIQRYLNGMWTAYSPWSYYTQAVWGTSNDDIWAVGYAKGTSAHFDGVNWTGSSAPAGQPYLNSVSGRDSSNVWAVGDGGQIDYWDGNNWSACTKVTQSGLNSVSVSATEVWAVGSGGVVLRND
jgi:hypothetical protein